MTRPPKPCQIAGLPVFTHFKPRGIPSTAMEEIYLPLEGWEAVRLVEKEGRSQSEAAGQMGISRQTFGRILARARKTLARAIIEGKSLAVHGGNFKLSGERVSLSNSACKNPAIEDTPPARLQKEPRMSCIAVTSEGPSLDDAVDPRFGRAAGFLIYHPEDASTDYVDNGLSQTRSQGAGIQAAETVARAGVTVLLTGYVGPKAYQALTAAGIAVGQDLENMTVREAIECYQKGQATMAAAPNRPGHWK